MTPPDDRLPTRPAGSIELRPGLTLRLARAADTPQLEDLVERAFRTQCVRDYDAAAVADAAGSAMRFDARLLVDGRVFVVETHGRVVATASWTRDPSGLTAPDLRLDPDCAVVRNVCTDPDHAGRGLARRLMQRCHADAAAAGCHASWLLATLTGVPLYERLGYRTVAGRTVVTPAGHAMQAVLMTRPLDCAASAA